MRLKHIGIILVGFSLLGSCVISQSKSKSLYQSASSSAPYDCIIVPGIPYDGRQWSTPMQIRMLWSTYLVDKGIARNCIYSGSAVYSPYYESKVMAQFGASMGVPTTNISLDTLAQHSTENVYYSYQVAKKNGWTRIALATDPFQAGSLRKFIKKHQLPIDLIPIVFDTIAELDHSMPAIDARSTQKSNFTSLKEKEGFFKRLNGTFGKQIIWRKSDVPSKRLQKKYSRQGRLIEG